MRARCENNVIQCVTCHAGHHTQRKVVKKFLQLATDELPTYVLLSSDVRTYGESATAGSPSVGSARHGSASHAG